MKIGNSKYIILLMFFVLVDQGLATEYFVSSASEITSTMAVAQPGDTLTMTNGVWRNQSIKFAGNGTAQAPILLRAERPGFMILNGTSTLRIAGSYLVVDGLYFVGGYSPAGAVVEFRYNSGYLANHSRLTNSAIIDYNPSFKSTDYKWVSLYGSHNRVDHCYFEGKNHLGTTLVVWLAATPNYHLIDQNYFAYRPPLGENGGETIRIGTSDWSMYDSYTVVESNYFERCNGETEIISNKSCENIFRYNTFYECEGTLTLRHGNRATVQGNFFFGNKKRDTGGVRVIGEDHKVFNNYFVELYGTGFRSALPIMNGVPDSPLNRYFQVKNASIASNTFVNCQNTIVLGAGTDAELTLPPENCVMANNLVLANQEIIDLEAEPINMLWEGNIMLGSSLGIPQPEGITLTDPQLSLAADGLWRPESTSPALGGAVGNYAFVIDDMDGQSRGENKDVGADQASVEPMTRRPLTAADVGPGWLDEDLPVVLTMLKTGSGTIQVAPAGGVYDSGTEITLTATPDSGWAFDHWEGDATGTVNPLTLTISENLTIRVVFVDTGPKEYSLSVFVFAAGGSVQFDPSGGIYLEGTTVLLTAIPDSGYYFEKWGGDLTGSANPDSILIDGDKMVLATFKKQPTGVTDQKEAELGFTLHQNYPNPFNSCTNICFLLNRADKTTLKIYNLLGHEVATLVNVELTAGSHLLRFDATALSTGVYIFELRSGKFSSFKKMLFMK